MPSIDDVIVLGLSILSLYSVGLFLRKQRALKTAPYPPGPRGYPIVHNLLDIPTGKTPWADYAELGKKYGTLTASAMGYARNEC
jgi:hypothetical protein